MLTVWQDNVIGSSGKGSEYFLRNMLKSTSTFRLNLWTTAC